MIRFLFKVPTLSFLPRPFPLPNSYWFRIAGKSQHHLPGEGGYWLLVAILEQENQLFQFWPKAYDITKSYQYSKWMAKDSDDYFRNAVKPNLEKTKSNVHG